MSSELDSVWEQPLLARNMSAVLIEKIVQPSWWLSSHLQQTKYITIDKLGSNAKLQSIKSSSVCMHTTTSHHPPPSQEYKSEVSVQWCGRGESIIPELVIAESTSGYRLESIGDHFEVLFSFYINLV